MYAQTVGGLNGDVGRVFIEIHGGETAIQMEAAWRKMRVAGRENGVAQR